MNKVMNYRTGFNLSIPKHIRHFSINPAFHSSNHLEQSVIIFN